MTLRSWLESIATELTGSIMCTTLQAITVLNITIKAHSANWKVPAVLLTIPPYLEIPCYYYLLSTTISTACSDLWWCLNDSATFPRTFLSHFVTNHVPAPGPSQINNRHHPNPHQPFLSFSLANLHISASKPQRPILVCRAKEWRIDLYYYYVMT
jgi:hypothetical protein